MDDKRENRSGKPGFQRIGDLLPEVPSSPDPTVLGLPRRTESPSGSAITGSARGNQGLTGTPVSAHGSATKPSSQVVALAPHKPSLPNAVTVTGLASLPRWLQKFRYQDGLPEGVTREYLERLKSPMDARLVPCSTAEFARAMDRLFEFARAFGIRDFDPAIVTRLYRQAMPDIPAIPLESCVDKAIKTWKWAQLPKPADLLEMADESWSECRGASNCIASALLALAHDRRFAP